MDKDDGRRAGGNVITLDPNINFSRANVTLTNSSANHDYATSAPYTRFAVTSGCVVTGLSSPVAGEMRTFAWGGSGGDVAFAHENANSSASNRFLTVFGAALTVGPNGRLAVTWMYDASASRWRPV